MECTGTLNLGRKQARESSSSPDLRCLVWDESYQECNGDKYDEYFLGAWIALRQVG